MGSGGSIFRRSSKTVTVLQGHEGSVNAMRLSADGSLLATASEDGICRVWDTETLVSQAEMAGHSQYINCIAVGGQYVATGSADKSIRLWDMHTGKSVAVFRGHQSVVNEVLLHESSLFSTSFDHTARHWSLLTGACLQVYRGHTRGVSPLLLLDLGLPDTRPQRRKSRNKLDRRISSCSVSLSQQKVLLVTGSADSTARAWSLGASASVMVYKGHGSAVLCLAASEGNRELFSGSSDGTARSWDIETGQPLRVFDGHQGAVVCLKLYGDHLFTGSADNMARCWSADMAECSRVYRGHRNSITALTVEGDLLGVTSREPRGGGHVFTSSNDGQVRAWEVGSGGCAKVFRGHDYPVNCILLSGDRLYSGSYDKTVRIWNVASLLKLTDGSSRGSTSTQSHSC